MNIRDLFSDFAFWLEAGFINQHFPFNKILIKHYFFYFMF